jgi:hypothetical protein
MGFVCAGVDRLRVAIFKRGKRGPRSSMGSAEIRHRPRACITPQPGKLPAVCCGRGVAVRRMALGKKHRCRGALGTAAAAVRYRVMDTQARKMVSACAVRRARRGDLPVQGIGVIRDARGYVTGGVTAFILAKLVATAVFARLYQLTEHAIIQFRWVRRTRAAFLRGRAFVHAWLNAQPPYRRARVLMRGSSQRIKHR